MGDTLPGNASLREVRERRIVIQRAGALETLTFPETEGRGQLAVRDDRRGGSGDSNSTGPEQAAGDDVRSRLNELRDKLTN